jgi:hypothetical protein
MLSSFTVLLCLCGHLAGALLLGQSEQAGLASFAVRRPATFPYQSRARRVT